MTKLFLPEYYNHVMKVDCINKQLSFTAGQINFYSDFDGTYFPANHSELHDLSEERRLYLQNYFDRFEPLLKEDDLHFTITSGRTLGEFQTVAELMKSKGLKMAMPDTFIAKNGSDEYVRVATDNEYYNQGKFPFNYDIVNTSKRQEIERLTGWSDKIKDKLREILKKHYLQIIECESENSAKDYPQGSLMAHVQYDNFELTDNMKPKSEWKVGLRKDGKLKIYASFPYDMLNVGERSYVYDQIKKEFEGYLKENKVEFAINEERDVVGGNRPIFEYSPQFHNKTPLTKLYDTKEAVKKAIENNDFVIAAGDGKNDFDMLNPLNYIETNDLDANLQKQLINISEENISEILENPTIAERLRKLPFAGIIVKGESSELGKLAKYFEKFNKLIETECGNLQDAIKQAVENYKNECPQFAENLSENLKIQLGIVEKPVQESVIEIVNQTTDTVKNEAKKTKGGKIAAIGAAITAGLSSIYYLFKKNNKTDKQS